MLEGECSKTTPEKEWLVVGERRKATRNSSGNKSKSEIAKNISGNTSVFSNVQQSSASDNVGKSVAINTNVCDKGDSKDSEQVMQVMNGEIKVMHRRTLVPPLRR
ncbi:hypothetical protein ACFE04_011091 [Oxalis oulophora]